VPEPTFVPASKPPTAFPPPERRRAPRHRCQPAPMIRFVVRPSFRAHRASLRDISACGVGLHLWLDLRPGTLILILLPAGGPAAPAVRLARVVRARAQAGYGFRVGCRFTRPLTDEELEDLLSSLQPPA
jgi:hypothetical protein